MKFTDYLQEKIDWAGVHAPSTRTPGAVQNASAAFDRRVGDRVANMTPRQKIVYAIDVIESLVGTDDVKADMMVLNRLNTMVRNIRNVLSRQ